jgi:hypothetical protein
MGKEPHEVLADALTEVLWVEGDPPADQAVRRQAATMLLRRLRRSGWEMVKVRRTGR